MSGFFVTLVFKNQSFTKKLLILNTSQASNSNILNQTLDFIDRLYLDIIAETVSLKKQKDCSLSSAKLSRFG